MTSRLYRRSVLVFGVLAIALGRVMVAAGGAAA
jgi:hypothetical protein